MRSLKKISLVFMLVAVCLTGCSPIPPAPFSLNLKDGTGLPLYPDSRAPEGSEAVIGEKGRTSVLYSLETPYRTADPDQALWIEYTLSGSARVELFGEESSKRSILSVELGRGVGTIEWCLPLPQGVAVRSVRFETIRGDRADETGSGESRLIVRGLSITDAEYGFERTASGARFSQGASLVRTGANGTETIRVEHPYASDDRTFLALEAGSGPAKIRSSGGRSAEIRFSELETVFLPLSVLGGAGDVSAVSDAPGTLRKLAVRQLPSGQTVGSLADPLPVDLAAILALPVPEDGTRPYALFRWAALPATLVFDFRDYSAQDAYLKRLAFFVEKEGFRGRLASDAELSGLHGWNAHDYRARDLAAFFDKAERTSFPLSREERELLEILERSGILVRKDGRVLPDAGAIISISRESSAYLRKLFIDHEASHALLFQDEAYRRLAESLWKAQGREERRFWDVFLSNRDYDFTDAYLSYNEFQAYMVQQPLSQLESWFRDIAYARLAKSYPDRAASILEDLETAMPGFKKKAASLDAYLRETYGLRAGSLERIRFE